MQIFQEVILIIICIPIEGIESCTANVCRLTIVLLGLFHKGVVCFYYALVEWESVEVRTIGQFPEKIGSFLEDSGHGAALGKQTGIMEKAFPKLWRIHHPECAKDGLLLEIWVIGILTGQQ